MNTNLITWEEDYRNPHGLLQSSPPFVTIIKKIHSICISQVVRLQ